MSGLSIQVRDNASGHMASLIRGLRGRRREMNEEIASDEAELVQNHFVKISAERHDTAERLGATPSGFWGSAVENTSFGASDEAATVSIKHPGIGRAGHDVDITPSGGKTFLAIPQIAAAYNQRAYLGLIFAVVDKRPVLAKKTPDGLVVWYALVKSVHQKQDRTLLPSDREILDVAKLAIARYADVLFGLKGEAS